MNNEPINLSNYNDIAPHLVLQESEAIIRAKADDLPRAVFFPGDILPSKLKRIPTYRLGGKLVDLPTVPSGIITRCAITKLEKSFLAVHKNLVDPKDRSKYVQSYVKTNVWNPVARKFENVEIGTSGASVDLVFAEIFPSQQVGQLTGKNQGIVEIPIVRNIDDIKTAQMFYFPDWFEYLTGQKEMPQTLSALTDHLRKRLAEAGGSDMRQVGEAMLEACRQYRDWAVDRTSFQGKQIKDAEKFPGAHQSYDEISERLFAEIGMARADNMTENFSKNMEQSAQTQDKLTDILGEMSKQSAQTNQINALLLNHLTGGNAQALSVQNASTIALPPEVLQQIVEQVTLSLKSPESRLEAVELVKDDSIPDSVKESITEAANEAANESESDAEIENEIEKTAEENLNSVPVPKTEGCKGKTSKELPCKMPVVANGFCIRHQEQAPQA